MDTCTVHVRSGQVVCDLIKKGVRVDLEFRMKYPKDVAESVLKYCGRVVSLSRSTTILGTEEHIVFM
jgi:hypothetical protein